MCDSFYITQRKYCTCIILPLFHAKKKNTTKNEEIPAVVIIWCNITIKKKYLSEILYVDDVDKFRQVFHLLFKLAYVHQQTVVLLWVLLKHQTYLYELYQTNVKTHIIAGLSSFHRIMQNSMYNV